MHNVAKRLAMFQSNVILTLSILLFAIKLCLCESLVCTLNSTLLESFLRMIMSLSVCMQVKDV